MRKLILIWMLFWAMLVNAATSYTEFYCRADGTNINAGSTTNAAAVVALDAGNWTNAVGSNTFYLASADLSGVTVGMWASVWTNATAPTNAVYISRIIGVDDANDIISVSTSAYGGTSPGDSVGGASIRIGGAWFGAFKATGFPFSFVANTMTNVSGNIPCVNIWSGYSNLPTATVTHNLAGPVLFQGYTSTPRDGGKAIFDAAGGTFTILIFSTGTGIDAADIIAQNNSAASATYYGISLTANASRLNRCVAHNIGGYGISLTGQDDTAVECEAYDCNKANGVTYAGFNCSQNSTLLRCFSHDNTGNQCYGVYAVNPTLINCLFVSNGLHGVGMNGAFTSGRTLKMIGCDVFGNGGHGLYFDNTASQAAYIENCNFIKNGGYGIASITNGVRVGFIERCGFGTGTMANALGTFGPNIGTTNGLFVGSMTTYAADVNPYANAAANNYSILTTSAAYGSGRGLVTDTAHSGGTVSYPNIGATASTNAASSAGEHSHVFAQ